MLPRPVRPPMTPAEVRWSAALAEILPAVADLRDAAAAVHVCARTLQRWRAAGRLRTARIGRREVVARDDLARALAAGEGA